jgi:diguanylate cyclase (GGDEF)-like protein
MERRINKGIRRHERDKTVFSLVFVDIDDFKRVNDTYGHRVGDKCLQSLVGRMRQVLRESDHIARYGGDEFVIFLANTGKKAAQVVANKLSSAISKTCFLYRNTEIQLSVSIGITQIESGDTSPEEIIARADTALYEAKNLGKDCIIVT